MHRNFDSNLVRLLSHYSCNKINHAAQVYRPDHDENLRNYMLCIALIYYSKPKSDMCTDCTHKLRINSKYKFNINTKII